MTKRARAGPVDAEGSNYRGMGERLMMMMVDEFFFFKAMVYPTIIPLLVNGAALMLTSSMSVVADDVIRRMIYAKLEETGAEVFKRFDWIRACADCVAKNEAARCTHIEQRPQHFQPRGGQRRVKALMRPFGANTYDREMRNITEKSTSQPLFEPLWLDALRDRARDYAPSSRREHRHVFIGVDPAGEGFSQCVIISALFDTLERPPDQPYTCVVRSTSMASSSSASSCSRSLGSGHASGAPVAHMMRQHWTKSRVARTRCSRGAAAPGALGGSACCQSAARAAWKA